MLVVQNACQLLLILFMIWGRLQYAMQIIGVKEYNSITTRFSVEGIIVVMCWCSVA